MDLSSLGITKKETQLYLALLELGEATATDIAKRAKIKRTTAYNILPSLIERGFIQTTQKRGIKYFFIEDVKSILSREEERVNKIKSILPKLQALHNIFPQKPIVTIHEGLEGFKYIYNDFLKTTIPGDFVRVYAGIKELFELVSKDLLVEFMHKRIKSKIQTRIITNLKEFSPDIDLNSKSALRETKFFTGNNVNFHGETIIYNGKVAFISYKEDYLGVIVESQQIYQMHKAVFDELWEKL